VAKCPQCRGNAWMVSQNFKINEILLRCENNHVYSKKLLPKQMKKVKKHLLTEIVEPPHRPPRRRNQSKKDVSLEDLF